MLTRFLFLCCFAIAASSSAQISVVDTMRTEPAEAIALPKDSLHKEFYLVAPEYEYIPGDETPELIASRLTCIQTDFPLKYNKTVLAFIQYFTVRDREYTKAMLRKQSLYFPLFEKYLKQYNLPDDLKYLSIIESGLNPRAVSHAKAVGLWQFMHYTGKHYGLTTDWYWDDRQDPEKSTEAACRLLADLYKMFNNWELALAAYNSGPGTVMRANKKSGYKNDFWQIYSYLPRETRAYVPQFVAIIYAMKYAEEHNLFQPYAEAYPPIDTIRVKSYLNLETLANLTGTCLDELHFLNPAIKTKALPAGSRWHTIKMSITAKQALQQNAVAILDSASKAGKADFALYQANNTEAGKELTYYAVKSGDALGLIAQRYGVRQDDLKRWNNLTSNLIHPGQRLKIWVKPSPAVRAQQTTIVAAAPDVYVVQAGDSLWDISQKFKGLTIDKIKQLNNLSGNNIKPGQKLVLK
jgi:membrane-bound lytic murein transglycosylase D